MSTLPGERSGRLSQVEFHQVRWLLGQLLALVALWSAVHLEFVSVAYFVGFFGVVALVTIFPGIPARLPKVFWMLASPVLLLLVTGDFIFNRAMPLEPLVRMVMLLLLLRCLQYRSRREDLQLVLLCLFLTVVGGVLTVSLTFAAQMLVFTPVAMALLFVLSLCEKDSGLSLEGRDWQGFRWNELVRRQWQALDLRLIGLGFVVLVFIGGMTALLFLAIPRIQMEGRLSFWQMESQASIGFNETIKFGTISRLNQDDSAALRVQGPPRESLASTPYWRMIVLDSYTDDTFKASDEAGRTQTLSEASSYRPSSAEQVVPPGRGQSWEFFLEGGTSRYLPVLGPFRNLKLDSKRKLQVNQNLFVYQVDPLPGATLGYKLEGMTFSERIPATDTERLRLERLQPTPHPRNAHGRPAEVRYPVTTVLLPYDASDRAFLEAAVEEITGGEDLDAAAFAQRAGNWLARRHSYNLQNHFEHRPGDGDYLVAWMRGRSNGWCEHFAGAFTLLARSAGYPTRVVAGFRGASWNEFENYFVVRNSDAHAWVEIYDGDGHWLRADPTPGGQTPRGGVTGGGNYDIAIDGDWHAWVDSLRMIWYRSVINFDRDDQDEIAGSLATFGENLWREVKQEASAGWERLLAWLRKPWSQERMLRVSIGLTAVALLLLLLMRANRIGAWLFGDAPRVVRLGAGRNLMRRRSGRWLRRLAPWRARVRAARPPWAADFEAVYGQLLQARYGDPLQQSVPVGRSIARARKLLKRCQRLRRNAPASATPPPPEPVTAG